MGLRSSLATAAILAALAAPRLAAGVTLGQLDSFEDGTTQNWVVGLLGSPHPAPPVNVATGGPAGAGDHFLQVTAVGGIGAGNRLTVINPAQWAGNYEAAGVTGIAMDVFNLGNTNLALRLLFEDPTIAPPSNEAVSSSAISVPAGSGWSHIVFPITAGDLTAVFGSVDAALSNATAIRIFHATTAAFPGDPIVAQLGVDNIRAVPEPAAATLLAFALGWIALVRRRA